MSKHDISPDEERHLLNIQCELARLKIMAAQKRMQRQKGQREAWLHLLFAALTAWSHQPSTWRTAARPHKKAYRTLLLGTWLLERWVKRSAK